MAVERTNLSGLTVALAVSGGIAAYKAVELASRLVRAGVEIRTVMTQSACRLVGPKSFEAVTNSPVYTDMWRTGDSASIGHIQLAEWARLVVVAPATANIIAKIANGICDELVSTMLCASWGTPCLLAPAMNDRMWGNPAVEANVKRLKQLGYHFVGPREGFLACGREAMGRMSEPQEIIEAVEKLAGG